ncbi:UNKNOWN [Stylonychia lemnae]|uniref:Centrosomal protein of 19 kDa n=1 Tax=Stylonychia lemnae TaxID=5949 RepID=A0A078B9E6_STYLE|nr:UNKNOWN [Stylonychia lemnae]|eukprot:CDW91019.1 UNKNOWN [Stylonychia lemnae]
MSKGSTKQSATLELSYQVPSSTGGFLPADPIKFCLRFKPPTIAIVYQILHSQKGQRKYVHEIKVDLKENSDINKLCEELFVKERTYFNPQKISRQQVLDLLNKLYSQLYKQNKENKIQAKPEIKEEEQRKPAVQEKKKFPAYDEQFDDSDDDVKPIKKIEPVKNEPSKDKKGNMLDDFDDEDDTDPWNLEAQKKIQQKPAEIKPNLNQQVQDNKNKNNPFDQKVKPAFDDLEDIGFELDSDRPIEFNNNKQKKDEDKFNDLFGGNKGNQKRQETEDNGLFVDNDFGDEFEDDYENDFDDENQASEQKSKKVHKDEDEEEDIFEKSRSKDNKKADEQKPAKDELKGDNQIKNEVKATGSLEPDEDEEEDEEDGDGDPESQARLINEQFNQIYENDPQLRQVLGNEINGLSLEEKYQIMTAYLNGGGVQGLLGEDDEKAGIDDDDARAIENEFNTIYTSDSKLREILQGQDPTKLTLEEKYEILAAYKKGGGVQGLLGGLEEEEEESIIEHNGQKFKRVQIEGEAQEYLMDEAGNIYDGEFNFIGQANNSDEEDG